MLRRAALAAGLALLAGCGSLPQPFRGRPGRVAQRLARPPAFRLAIPTPLQARLTQADAETLARLLAESLSAQDIPAAASPALPLDWQLAVLAQPEGGHVLPSFLLTDADGRSLGRLAGRSVPGRDWTEGGAPVLRSVATDAAPRLAEMLARADAARRLGDPNAAGAGPPVLRLLPVTGAPGDGNRSLTARMRERLARFGFIVQDQAEGAGFAVSGEVEVANSGRNLQRVEITWTVSRRDGEDLGRVLQLNEVPAGTLNGLWGDVAAVVAEEAAGGIRDVVTNAGGFQPATPTPAAAAVR